MRPDRLGDRMLRVARKHSAAPSMGNIMTQKWRYLTDCHRTKSDIVPAEVINMSVIHDLSLWRNGPQPGSTYNFPGGSTQNASGTQRTL